MKHRVVSGVRRAGAYLLPSMIAALLAAVIAGLAEGGLHTATLLQALAAAGFLAFLAVPAGLLLALVCRGLWHAWQMPTLLAELTEDTGGAPRLAAWLACAMLGCWGLGAVCFNAIRLLYAATAARIVIALAATLIVSATAVAMVVLSRPAARALAALFRVVDRRIHRRLGRSLLTPRIIGIVAVAKILALLLGAWLITISPRIGDFDIRFMYYVAGFGLVLAAVHGAWLLVDQQEIRARLARGLTVAALVAGSATIASALYTRYQQPYTMLEVWGSTQLAGGAVDAIYDIDTLRGSLDLRQFRPPEQPGAAHPDIVLITIDTLRADRTSVYGGKPTMPALAKLAQEATVFEWAFAPSNVTRRSLPSMMTGLGPLRVHGRVAGWALRMDPRHITVTERLRAAGYDTAGFFCCESQFAPRHRLGLIRGIDHLVIERKAENLALAARAWLYERQQAKRTAPVFMWLHFIEPHLWESGELDIKIGGDLKQRYDQSLTLTDRALQVLLAEIWSETRKQHTVVVITSDHGEALGDHGFRTHSTSLYNAEIRVPLVVAGPGIPAQRIYQAVGLMHLAPTLLDLAGYEPPGMPQMDAVSLAPLIRGTQADDVASGEAFAYMVADRSVKTSMRALIAGTFKYIERDDKDTVELYDISKDPNERTNLAKSHQHVLGQMQERMRKRQAIDMMSPFQLKPGAR